MIDANIKLFGRKNKIFYRKMKNIKWRLKNNGCFIFIKFLHHEVIGTNKTSMFDEKELTLCVLLKL